MTKWSIMADLRTTLPKFNKFGLAILILGTSAIMDQTACCHNVTTPKTDLYFPFVCQNISARLKLNGPRFVIDHCYNDAVHRAEVSPALVDQG